VPEEVAREKVSQCLRDIVKVVSKPKHGEQCGQDEGQRGLTSEALLNGIELDEAKAFVRVSIAAAASQPSESDGRFLSFSTRPPNSNYSLNNSVSDSRSNDKPSDEECAYVKQAMLRAEQLKNDDSAFHRLIDRMLLEEK
jgi:hypothetical protein